MNKEDNGVKKVSVSIIAAIIILIIAAILSIILINYSNKLENNNKKTIFKNSDVETTTTTNINSQDNANQDNTSGDTVDAGNYVVSNFSASLSDILNGVTPNGDYSYNTIYSGARFDFNCTNYDTNSNTCTKGSGLMTTSNAVIPLYTYDNENDNYLNKSDDYYIIVTDDNIILLMNSEAKVYDKSGNYITSVYNIIYNYKYGDEDINLNYPFFTKDNKFDYYTCDNGIVHIKEVDINYPGDILNDEILDNSHC